MGVENGRGVSRTRGRGANKALLFGQLQTKNLWTADYDDGADENLRATLPLSAISAQSAVKNSGLKPTDNLATDYTDITDGFAGAQALASVPSVKSVVKIFASEKLFDRGLRGWRG